MPIKTPKVLRYPVANYFRYALNPFSKKRISKHYDHNPLFEKNGFWNLFSPIQKWTFINVHFSKNFFETQNDYLTPILFLILSCALLRLSKEGLNAYLLTKNSVNNIQIKRTELRPRPRELVNADPANLRLFEYLRGIDHLGV